MESILITTKKLSGISGDYDYFDIDIIMYINSVFLDLKQLGVGPVEGFVITDEDASWMEFLPDNAVLREATKAYMAAKVRLKFDPPSNSTHMEALKRSIDEYEFRANVEVTANKNKEG